MKTLNEVISSLSKKCQGEINTRAANLIKMVKIRKCVDTAWLIIRAPFIIVLMILETVGKIAKWPFKKIYKAIDCEVGNVLYIFFVGLIAGLGFWFAGLSLSLVWKLIWNIF